MCPAISKHKKKTFSIIFIFEHYLLRSLALNIRSALCTVKSNNLLTPEIITKTSLELQKFLGSTFVHTSRFCTFNKQYTTLTKIRYTNSYWSFSINKRANLVLFVIDIYNTVLQNDHRYC